MKKLLNVYQSIGVILCLFIWPFKVYLYITTRPFHDHSASQPVLAGTPT